MRSSIGGTNHSKILLPTVADGSRSIDPSARDPRSPTALYRAHSAYVWRVLRHCGVPDDDLDDAVQETFLVVLRRLPQFEARASVRTWIYAVAVRVASTRRRSRQREARRRDRAGPQMHGSSSTDPEAALSKAQAADLVDRLLDELDPKKRTVFVLAELEGVKVPEISRILGVNARTVHSRLRLARERFGTALRRLAAREQGNRRLARLRPGALVRDAANDRPPAPRRKAVCAALVVRIEQGATPQLPGWQSLSLASGGSRGALPVAAATTVAASGAALATWAVLTASPPRDPPDRHAVPVATRVASPPAPAPAPSAPEPAPATTPTPTTHGPSEPTPVAHPTSAPRPTPTRRAPNPSDPAPTPPSSTAPRSATAADPAIDPRPGPTTSTPPDPASTLAEETELLERARQALRRGDPESALAVVDEHLERFADGRLADEARSTRIRSLCAAGRPQPARAYADRLSGGAADSRWHRILAASCSP